MSLDVPCYLGLLRLAPSWGQTLFIFRHAQTNECGDNHCLILQLAMNTRLNPTLVALLHDVVKRALQRRSGEEPRLRDILYRDLPRDLGV